MRLSLFGKDSLLALWLAENTDRAINGFQHLLRLYGSELEHRRARKDRVVNIEIGVLGRGRDQGDRTVLDELEQGLLLLLVEILDLVEIEQHAVQALEGVEGGYNLFDIGGGGSGAVELLERTVGDPRDIGRKGRFADAGRPVEYQVGDRTALDDLSKRSARS